MIQKILIAMASLCVSTTAMAQTPFVVLAQSSGNVNSQDVAATNFRGTPMLQSFRLRYVIEDHHIQTIGIMPTTNQVKTVFRDKNGDDPYKWYDNFR